MFKDIYVKFPPGEESIEFQFFLEIEGERFYEFYKKKYKNPLSDLSEYFPEYQETYEDYLKNFLLPYLKWFKEIRLNLDTWKNECIWIGINQDGKMVGILLPKVDFDFYKGAISYRNWQGIRNEK